MRNRHLMKTYGLTLDEYRILSESQNGRCAICRNMETAKNKVLAVDHDRFSGEIRGLLCHKCNAGLGLFNEQILLLEEAALYLSKRSAWVL